MYLQTTHVYIYIYIYIERERDREICICVCIYIYIYIYIYTYFSATQKEPPLLRCLARRSTRRPRHLILGVRPISILRLSPSSMYSLVTKQAVTRGPLTKCVVPML